MSPRSQNKCQKSIFSGFHLSWASARRLLLIFIFLSSLVGASPVPVQAAGAAWTAYNDCQNVNSNPADRTTNITTVKCRPASSGNALRNYADNSVISGVTFDVATSGTVSDQTSSSDWGAIPTGGDAVSVFNPYVTMRGGLKLNSSATVTLTFKGLSPSKTYTFATSANRAGGSSYADRKTTFTLSGVDGATNTSSTGTTASGYTTAFSTGENTDNGYIARWEGINPGSDGTFAVAASGANGYGPAVFLLSEESTDPAIHTTGTLSAFSSQPGVPSAAQTYTVSGANLSEDLSIDAPDGFELSTDGSAYSPNLTLTPSGGTVASTTIYVRLNQTVMDTYSGSITHTSSGAAQVDLPVSGTVALCSTTSLTVAADTWLRSSYETRNYGGSTEIQVSPSSSRPQGSLYRWDLSSIPAEATISAADLSFYVTESSEYAFSLYNLKRAWVEGTNDDEEGTGASWTYYGDGTGEWGEAGAASTTSDRADTNLWDATESTFGDEGNVSIPLNSSGLQVVQGWVAGTTDNYGLTMQNYSGGSTSDYWIVASSEATDAARRPRLNVTYCLPTTDPTIITTGTLSAFSSQPGAPSAAQTYTVSGVNLTEDLSIHAPDGFELSTDGSTYSSSLTLSPLDGVVAATTIYVRLNQADLGTYSGSITHTGSGAAQVNLAVTGKVALCSTANLAAVEDTWLRASQATTNYGGAPTLSVNANSNYSQVALLKWDLSAIPVDATVESASLTLYATDASTTTYSLYDLRRAWVEGSGTADDTPSTNSANWNTYDGTNAWGTAGAQSTSADRGATNLWDTTAIASTGAQTRNLNGSGVAVVQNWLTNPAGNYGLTLQNSASSSDYLVFASSEATEAAQRPLLNVTYCVAGTSAAIITHGTLNPFTALQGVPSAAQTYTVSGVNLTGEITISAPDGFELSTDGSTYGASLTLSPLDGTVDSTTVYVRLYSGALGTYSGSIAHTSSGAGRVNVAVSGTVTDGNVAPAAPVLVQPADDATSVTTPPSLQVTVSDPNPGDRLDVSFYGRPAGDTGGTSAEDFMLVLIPDSQNASQNKPEMFNAQTNWIVSHRDSDNIAFVTHTGDVVNTSSSRTEYEAADAAVDILDAGGVWYTMAPGNHDTAMGTSYYSEYFGVSRYAGYRYEDGYWFGGSYNDYNTYSLFSASGNDFILINLQYSPATAVLDWADALLKAHSDRRAIVEQHDMLNVNDTWNNATTFNALKDNPNLFLMLCGHMHAGNDGAAYRTEQGDYGQTIHVVQADYQDMTNGNGYLRLLRFSPANDLIYMTTYSPYADVSLTTSPDQMNLAYDLEAGASFELIGTVNDVANGGTAALAWNGLLENTAYEWYAVVSDGKAETQGATWDFTTGVTGNQSPVIGEGSSTSVTMSEDGSPTAFDLTLHATDVDSSTLTWSISSAASKGTASASGTGASRVIGYTPNTDYAGSDSFVVQVSDGNGGTDTITVNVTITAINDAPVITGQAALSTAEDTSLAVTLANLTYTDVDSTSGFSLALQTGANYTLSGNILTPAANFNGTLTVPATVSDGSASSAVYNLSVTVTPVNDAPVISEGASIDVAMSENGSPTAFDLTLNATDVDGGTLTWSILSGAANGVATASGTGASKAIGYAPNLDYNGSDSFVVQVSDGSGGTDSITVNVSIEPTNSFPVIREGASTSVTMSEDGSPTAFDLTLNATDADGDTLTWSVSSAASKGTASASGAGASKAIGYTPNPNDNGADSFVVQVSDGNGGTDAITVNVTITALNDAPVISGQTALSTAEDTPLAVTLANLTYSDVDNTTGFSLTLQNGANYSLSGNTLTPAANYHGTLSVPVTVSDGSANSAVYNLSVTVTPVNDAPVIISQADLTTAEDTPLTVTLADLTYTDVDSSSGFSLTLQNGSNYTLSGNTLTPAVNYHGTLTVPVTVSDGSDSSAVYSLTVTVTPVNDAPSITGQATLSTAEDTPLAVTLADLTVADVDNTAGFSLALQTGANYTLSGNAITPAADYHGPLTVPVTISDGSAISGVYNLTVTVTPVNDAPAIGEGASIDVTMTKNGTPTAFDLTLHAADVDSSTLTWSILSGAANGAASASGTGETNVIGYTPNHNYVGSDSFVVQVSDGSGSTDSIIVNVTIQATNASPVIGEGTSASVTMSEDGSPTAFDLTLHATDADEDTLTWSISGAASKGTASASGTGASKAVGYTPNSNDNGSDSFVVQVSDGNGGIDSITINVTTTAVNDAPVISGQVALSTAEDTPLTITPANLTIADVDNTSGFTLELQDGANYTLSGNTLTPAANFNGTLTVPVTVSDGSASSAVYNLSVTVTLVNDAPAISGQGDLTTTEDTPLTITLTDLTYSDVDSTGGFSLTLRNGANYSLSGDTLTPAANYHGTLTVPVTISDGSASSAVYNLTVTVTPVNDAPSVAGQVSLSTAEDTALTIVPANLAIVDVDNADGFTLTVQTGAKYTLSENTITPAANYYGTLTVPVTVSDGSASSDVYNLSVTVIPVNDAPVIDEGASTNVTMTKNGTPTAFDLTLHAGDVEEDTLTWNIFTDPAHGTASASGTGASKAIHYTPNHNYAGDDSFVVQVSDGNGGTDSITVNVTVQATNASPVIAEGSSVSVTMSEDGSPTAFDLTLHATDADEDTLTWSVSSGASKGTATVSGKGASKVIGYVPNPDANGSDTFTVQVSDGNGGVDTITVDVTITAVNDAPAITGQADLSTAEDTPLTVTLANLTYTDVDSTGGFSLALRNGANYSLSGNTITPAANYHGTLTVPVTVSDGSASSVVYNLHVAVTPVNDAPVITEGASIDVTMSANGSPVAFGLTLHAADADNTTLTWSILSGAANGTASVLGTGASKAVQYTPNPDYAGSDSFVVQVSDGSGGTATITVNVSISASIVIEGYKIFLPVTVK